jgi:hypothetical protein
MALTLKLAVEAAWLWGVTIGVVAIFSGVHYLLASAEMKELQARSKSQQLHAGTTLTSQLKLRRDTKRHGTK